MLRASNDGKKLPSLKRDYLLTIGIILLLFIGIIVGVFVAMLLKIETPGGLYSNGLSPILLVCAIACIVFLLLMWGIMYLLNHKLLNPLARLSADVESIDSELPFLNANSYSRSSEFFSLIKSINMMLERLEQNRMILQNSTFSLQSFQAVLNGLDAYLYVSDTQTDEILFINDRMKEHFGLEGDVVGSICWQVLQADFTERCDFCPTKKLLQDPDAVVVWEEHNTVTGHYYRNIDRVIEWANGEKVHLQHSTDITDIKQAEMALTKRLKQQELMSTISQSFTGAQDADVLIEEALKMAGEFMNVDQVFLSKHEKDERVLRCLYEWHGEGKKSFKNGVSEWPFTADMRIYENLINNGYGAIEDFTAEDHPNFQAVASYNIGAFLNMAIEIGGEFWGILGFTICGEPREWNESDIHLGKLIAGVFSGVISRNTAEQEIVHAKEVAEQANKAKTEFLSRMSHEMRTPMNAIIGMTSVAKASHDISKMEYCLGKIDNASKSLLSVINDVLDMSKIEANKLELTNAEFKFEKMLINITGVINFSAEEKHQNLLINFDESIPTLLVGDEMRLSQVITNLFSNAIKFTPEGGTITLNVHKMEGEEGFSQLRFEVIDTGIGLSKEQQSRLFAPFEQADGGIARKYGGSGLGLAICKRIVEKMGGRIWVESELGQGAKFIFTVKMKNGREEPRQKLDKIIDKNDLYVLAVDDSPEIRDYFTHIMPAMGLCCDVAEDGRTALQMVERKKDRQYNICFVDWNMPDMNGVELTERIKQIAKDNEVILMISVEDWGNIEKTAKDAGVNRFVSKPLFPSMILNAINESMGAVSTSKPLQGTTRLRNFKNHTILLAEDVEINREVIAALLEHTKVVIDYAENGRDAVERFKANPHKYSLILMDVHMPEMDGYEATGNIRAAENGKNVPIVAMTANVFREDIDRCLQVGMNDHIGKPVNVEELMIKLDKYLSFKMAAPAADNSSPGTEPKQALDYAQLLPALNVEDGLGRVMKNKKLYFKLLKSFSGPKMAGDIAAGINNSDFTQIQQAAHALKGVAANLGMTEIQKITAEIEARAKNSIATDDLLEALNQAVDAVTQAINTLLASEGEA